jgi:transposase
LSQNIFNTAGLIYLLDLPKSLAESEFVKSEKTGYSYAQKKITYGDIEQRWLVVQSQDRKKSDLEKLSKKIEKALLNTQTKLKKLAQEKFAFGNELHSPVPPRSLP